MDAARASLTGFADLLIDDSITHPGLRSVCVREYQVTLEQSVKRLLEDKIRRTAWSASSASSTRTSRRPATALSSSKACSPIRLTASSPWKVMTAPGWKKPRTSVSAASSSCWPPSCEEGSELWFSWNPLFPTDPVEKLLRGAPQPPGAIVIEISWRDNPFFPDVLRKEMEFDRAATRRRTSTSGSAVMSSTARRASSRTGASKSLPSQMMRRTTIGGDWGFSVDPAVLVRCHVDGRDCHRREAYRIGDRDRPPATAL